MTGPYTCRNVGGIFTNNSGTFDLTSTVSYASTLAPAQTPTPTSTPASVFAFASTLASAFVSTPTFALSLSEIYINEDLQRAT